MTDLSTWTLSSPHVVPPMQSSAPVLEFQCLYTSDLRRKQKRWQDGRLKFHTFNKRVMVYDDRANFVGDTHWCKDHDFAEGEELELERSGILVQVSDCVGTRDQDLSELLARRVKDREERVSTRALVPLQQSRPQACGFTTSQNPIPIPTVQETVAPVTDTLTKRCSKRRKPNDSLQTNGGYAQSLTGATLTLSRKLTSTATLCHDGSETRVLKTPGEATDLAGTLVGRHKTPGESRLYSNIGGKRAEKYGNPNKDEELSLRHRASGYAKSITGATLILTDKAMRGPLASSRPVTAELSPITLGISSTVMTEKLPTIIGRLGPIDEGGKRQPVPESMQGGTINNDLRRRIISRTEKLPGMSNKATELHRDRPKMSPQSASAATSHSFDMHDHQHQESFNPLRLKLRSKKKLLLIACPLSHSPSVTNAIERRCTGPSNSPTSRARDAPPSVLLLSARSDAFLEAQEQRLNARINRNRTQHDSKDIPSSSENEEIHHHEIDALPDSKRPRRKPSAMAHPSRSNVTTNYVCMDGIQQKSIAKLKVAVTEDHCLPGPLSKKVPSTEPKTVGKVVLEQVGRLRLGRNAGIKITDQDAISASAVESPARSLKKSVEGSPREEVHGSAATVEDGHCEFVSGHGSNTTNDRLVQLKPSTPLSNPLGRKLVVERLDLKIMRPSLISDVQPQVTSRTGSSAKDRGPWSREAFDLFDWMPPR